MFFTTPIFLLLILAIPVLILIYKLKSKHRIVVVSALFLWNNHKRTKKGGLTLKKLPLPLLFFLELLIIIFLILAALTPFFSSENKSKLWFVLDDSFSMLAGGEQSARELGEQEILRNLKEYPNRPIGLILANSSLQTLETKKITVDTLSSILDKWECGGYESCIAKGISYARQFDKGNSTIMVLSDHAPTKRDLSESIIWKAFGEKRNNIAIINATRTTENLKSRFFMEIANIADIPQEVTAIYDFSGNKKNKKIKLKPKEVKRITMSLPFNAFDIKVTLSSDDLQIDNAILLIPNHSKKINIGVDISNPTLKNYVTRAIESNNNSVITNENTSLIFTDNEIPKVSDKNWFVQISGDKTSKPFLGPFIVEKTHPLTNGLYLSGIIWGAKQTNLQGNVILSAGNIPLLTILKNEKTTNLFINYYHKLSNLHNSPNWPILISNIIDWRISESTGLDKKNYRLGNIVKITLPRKQEGNFAITYPNGLEKKVAKSATFLHFKPEKTGVYNISAKENNYKFSVNALSYQESNLLNSTYGVWGDLDSNNYIKNNINITWIFLLISILLLGIHSYLISPRNS